MVSSEHYTPDPAKLLVVVIAPYGQGFQEVIGKMQEDSELLVVECANSIEAVSVVRSAERSVVLFHGSEFEEVVKHVTMLKLLQKEIQNGMIRPIITTRSDEVAVLSKLTFYGCSEVIHEPVTSRSLLFKLQKHFKAVQKEKVQEKTQSETKVEKGRTRRSLSIVPDVPQGAMFRMSGALLFESDFWLLLPGRPKTIGGRWVIRMSGPSPSVGVWNQKNDGSWVWVPTDYENHPYIEQDGYWIFWGQKPEYYRNTWWFIGTEPRLEFYQGSNLVGSKITQDNFGVLTLARNSEAGMRAIPQIQSSIALDQERIRSKVMGRQEPSQIVKKALKSHLEEEAQKASSEGSSPSNSATVWVDAEQYGLPAGKWDFVCRHQKGESWYVYVPFLIYNQIAGAPDIRRLPEYWWYRGPQEPVLSPPQEEKVKWGFQKNAAEKVRDFDWLEERIRKHLELRFVPEGELARGQEEGSENEVNDSPPVDLEMKAKAVAEDKSNRIALTESKKEEIAVAESTLNPLVFALLVSEIVSRINESPKQIANEICKHLSRAFKGVRVEIWIKNQSAWVCAGTVEGGPGLYGKISDLETFPTWNDQGHLRVPIVLQIQDQEVIGGVIIFGGLGVEMVSLDSAQQFSVMLRGLVYPQVA